MLASHAPSKALGKNTSWALLVSGISHQSLALLSLKQENTFFCLHLQVAFLCVLSMTINLALQEQHPLVPRLLILNLGLIFT